MSAIVCRKRCFFEEVPTTRSTPLASKRHCYSSTCRIRLSPPITNHYNYNPFSSNSNANQNHLKSAAAAAAAVDRLRAIFPGMDEKLLLRALEESEDIEAAIKSLNELRLGSAETVKTGLLPSQEEINVAATAGVIPSLEVAVMSNLPLSGPEWVELLVNETASASNIDDARARASRVLEVLENSIRIGSQPCNLEKENMMLKEQVEVVIRENGLLKRAVVIQHARHKEALNKNQELQQLKQVVTEYQERLTTLEVDNYALTMHLRQALQTNSVPHHFNPEVF